MEYLINFFSQRARACIFIMIVLILEGYMSYRYIPKESSPDVKVPIIYTVAVCPGISPEDAERLIARPMETALRSIDGIKEITSYSSEGSASVILEFEAGFNSDKALNDVRAQINDIANKLPKDTKAPEIHEINLSLEPIISLVLSGDIPQRTLATLANRVASDINAIPGVLDVKIRGVKDEVVEITIKPEIIENYSLYSSYFQQLLTSNNQMIAAGSIITNNGQTTVKVPSVISSPSDILGLPVITNGKSIVKLSDIADIKNTYKEEGTEAKVNGKSAVVLDISKRTGQSIIGVIDGIKSAINSQIKFVNSKVEISFINDKSKRIHDMITELENGLILGVLLVLIIIMLTVGFKPSFLIALSLPTSFFAGILILDICGYTLNIVVLFSLILTVGMIVDDAIVVSEYADRKMIDGVPAKRAFAIAANRMLWPIVTSTLVKMLVFIPLLFWPGVIGQFMKYMPITVIIILSSSLVFAILMQPAIGPAFGDIHQIDEKHKESIMASENWDVTKIHGFTKKYILLLITVLARPKRYIFGICSAVILMYIGFVQFGRGLEFFPKVEPETAIIIIQSPGNLSFQEKAVIMEKVNAVLMQNFNKEVETFYMKSGDMTADNQLPANTIGTVTLAFVDAKKRRKADFILQDVRNALLEVKGINVQVMQERMGPPSVKSISFNVSAQSAENLNKAVDAILQKMRNIDGLIDVESSRSSVGVEWIVKVDRAKAIQYGMSIPLIGDSVRLVTNGLVVSTYRPEHIDEEVDIIVRYPREYRGISTLKTLRMMNYNNELIPLSSFASIYPERKVGEIKRVNRVSVITISADVKPGFLVDQKTKEIMHMLEEMSDGSFSISFAGDAKDQAETMVFLIKAFITALMLMFFVMILQFNSYRLALIVMSAVFLSTAGVLLGLSISFQPFGIVMSGIGIIALSGIVLNNNIIFIDTYQRLILDGIENEIAILMSASQRVRPILLTATTAILGLMPMVLGITIDFYHREILYGQPSSAMWRQLAASIAGGLSFATILTLFFTPCLLHLLPYKTTKRL